MALVEFVQNQPPYINANNLNNNFNYINSKIYLKPIATRILFYGDHFFSKNWSDLLTSYGLTSGFDNYIPGHVRWFRFIAWRNDNVTNGTGLQISAVDSNGTYQYSIPFSNVYGSGSNDYGSYEQSQFYSLNTINIGYTTLRTIIPSSSTGSQGHLFSLMLEAYDIPEGINPNNIN